MSRRPTRPARSTTPEVTAQSPCPCGLPAPYAECCGRMHTGALAAPTCEALMRSRYAAFVVRDEAYLLRSWHPGTRPPAVDFDPRTRWVRLEVLGTTEGSPFHATGTVTFRAHFTERGLPGTLHEKSRFARHEGAWVYVDGEFLD